MTHASFAVIPKSASHESLQHAVKACFPCPENRTYLMEIMSRKNSEGVRESLAALLLLGELLKKYGISPSALILARETCGKPYFANSSLKFSLSHSKGVVAAAFSDGCEVGIDIESSDITPEKAKKLAERFLGAEDVSLVTHFPERFAEMWTRKEAYAKMRACPLSAILSDSKKSEAERVYNEKNAFYKTFCVKSCPLTVCLEKESELIELAELDLDDYL